MIEKKNNRIFKISTPKSSRNNENIKPNTNLIKICYVV